MKDLEVFKMDKERISYKDLYELIDRHIGIVNENIKETNIKIDNLTSKLEEVRIQTTRTNGRVSALETWEYDVNKIIESLKQENKEQDKKLEVTSKDLAIITLKVTAILSFAGFIIYMATGFVI